MTVFLTDANGIRLPNNYNLLFKGYATRLFFPEICIFTSVKPKS